MDDSKSKALREHGTLTPQPARVTDDLFLHNEFFDPRDLLLVRYEMLRRVQVEGQSVAQAAKAFGVSRVTFYQVQAAFRKEGLPGLIPRFSRPSGHSFMPIGRRTPPAEPSGSSAIKACCTRNRCEKVPGSSGLWAQPRRITRDSAKPIVRGWMKSNTNRFSRWPATSPDYGRIPRRPTKTASGWSAF